MVILQKSVLFKTAESSLNIQKQNRPGYGISLSGCRKQAKALCAGMRNFRHPGVDVSGVVSREAAITLTNLCEGAGDPALPDRYRKRKSMWFFESSGWRGSLPCDGGSDTVGGRRPTFRSPVPSGRGRRCRGGKLITRDIEEPETPDKSNGTERTRPNHKPGRDLSNPTFLTAIMMTAIISLGSDRIRSLDDHNSG